MTDKITQLIEKIAEINDAIGRNARYLAGQIAHRNGFSYKNIPGNKEHTENVIVTRKAVQARLQRYRANKVAQLATECNMTVELPTHNETEMLNRLSENCEVTLYEPPLEDKVIRGIHYTVNDLVLVRL